MSKLPQLNLRIPEDFHGLVRTVAQHLRERDGPQFANRLDAWLRDLPQASGDFATARRLDELEARLEELAQAEAAALKALEARLAALEGRGVVGAGDGRLGELAPAPPPRRIPAEHLELAARLNDGGMGLSYAQIVQREGWPYSPQGLANAVARRRKGAHDAA